MVLTLCIGLQGCSLIDDDLSVCGADFEMILQMELITNLDLELETVLSAETDIHTRTILHDYFSNIFTDHAHDIAIGFYNTENDELVYSIHDVIDANQSTYTFYLPKNDYHAIALANLGENGVVSLADSANSRMARLAILGGDTLPTQHTGVFAVSRDVSVIDTADQKIDLTLHMASSAVALVIDTGDVHVEGIRALLCNTADGLYLRDSLYTFNRPRTVIMDVVNDSTASAAAAKHSAQNAPSRAQLEDPTEHFIFGCASFPSSDTSDGYGTYYQCKVYVTKEDGSITETVLSVRESLDAGELKVIKAQLQEDGEVKPIDTSEVGATVTLDWKDGGTHNIEL